MVNGAVVVILNGGQHTAAAWRLGGLRLVFRDVDGASLAVQQGLGHLPGSH
jgi:hypothetical protein